MGEIDRDVPVIFPDQLTHAIVAKHYVAAMKEHWPKLKVSILSAGDYNVTTCECSGKSETLKAVSHPKLDEHIILMYDILHGIVM